MEAHKFKFKTIFINFYHLKRIWFIPYKENSMKNNKYSPFMKVLQYNSF